MLTLRAIGGHCLLQLRRARIVLNLKGNMHRYLVAHDLIVFNITSPVDYLNPADAPQ